MSWTHLVAIVTICLPFLPHCLASVPLSQTKYPCNRSDLSLGGKLGKYVITPIFIICKDRVSYLPRVLESFIPMFKVTPYAIMLLDQGSTYGPMLDYLHALHAAACNNYSGYPMSPTKPSVCVHFGHDNYSKDRGKWTQTIRWDLLAGREMLENRGLQLSDYFILMDQDILLKGPSDSLAIMAAMLQFCSIEVVSAYIEINDVPLEYPGRLRMHKAGHGSKDPAKLQSHRWKDLKVECYMSVVDTHFGMWRANSMETWHRMGKGPRCDSPFHARHLDFYVTQPEYHPDLIYYSSRENKLNHWLQDIRRGNHPIVASHVVTKASACFNSSFTAVPSTDSLRVPANIAVGPITVKVQKISMTNWIMHNEGERKVAATLIPLLHECSRTPGHLVLDIGSNVGSYGLVAAKAGCTSLLFEPQPVCQAYIKRAIVTNNLQASAFLIPHPVGSGNSLAVSASTGCDGRFPISLRDKGKKPISQELWGQSSFVQIRNVICRNQEVLWLKIDVEGAELSVLQEVLYLFKQRLVNIAVIEVSPVFYEKNFVDRNLVARVFFEIASFGYTGIAHQKKGNDIILQTPGEVRDHIAHANFTQQDIELKRS